jgi:hypothetical protein
VARRPRFDEVHRLIDAAGSQIHTVDLGPEPLTAKVTTRSVQGVVPEALRGGVPRPIIPFQVALVPDATLVTDGGAVVDARGRLVLESLWDAHHWKRSFDPPPALPPAAHIPGRQASIVCLWSANYYHWLFEALPRLQTLRASGLGFDGLIIPAEARPFHYETLSILGFERDKLTTLTGGHVRVDELLWVSPLAPVGYPTSRSIAWLRRNLGGSIEVSPRRRLYVTRPGDRRLSNEQAVMALLAPYGFEQVDPGLLSFREQVELMSSARVIIGSHGAAFSTGIFSRELTAVELFHRSHMNISTIAALSAAGHEHWSLICSRRPRFTRPRHFHAVAPMRELVQTLRQIGALAE